MAEKQQPPSSGSILYNAETRQPDTVPGEKLEDAILSGSHGYQVGTRINVIKPDGSTVSVPSEQVRDVLGRGYKIERPEQYAVRKYVEENKGLTGTAKVFGGQFADEFLQGLPELVLDKTQDPLEAAKREALKKEHALANTLGGVGGFATSLYVGAPIFKGVANVGAKVAEKTAAPLLARVGIDSASKGLAKKIVNNAVMKGTQLGVEGVILSSPRAMTEAALGDTDAAAETLMVGGGIGVGLGVLGGASQAVFDKVKGAAKTYAAEKAQKAAARESAEAAVQTGEATLDDALRAENADSMADFIKQIAPKEKANAAEIRKAYERLGLKTHEGAVLDSPYIRQAEATLADSPSIVGNKWRKDFKLKSDVVERAAREGMGEVATATAVEAGATAKAKLLSDLDRVFEPAKEVFQEIRMTADAIPVGETSLRRVAKNLLDIDTVKQGMVKEAATTAESTLAKKAITRFENVKTLADLEIQMRLAADDLAAVATPGEKRIASIIRGKLDDLYENTLERFAKSQMKTPEAKQKILGILDQRKAVKRTWAEGLSDFSELGIAGKRGYSSPAAIREAIENTPPEQLAEKLFTKKNSGALTFLKERYPDTFEEIARFQRSKIMERATSQEGGFLPNAFFREFDKLSPEVQGLLFKDVQKLRDARIVNATVPKAFSSNPSKTDIRREFREFFSVGGAMSDAALAAQIKLGGMADPNRVAGLLAAEQAMKRVAEKIDRIPYAIEQLGQKTNSTGAGGRAARRRVSDAEVREAKDLNALLRAVEEDEKDPNKAIEKLRDKAAENMNQPEQMQKLMGTLVSAFGETGAPNVGNALQAKMMNAVRYLQESIPKPPAPSPFFKQSPYRPSDYQLAEFNKKLEVMVDPLAVVDRLADGTLTAAHVDALRVVYPKLYSTMTNRVLSFLSENKKELNYATRVKISLLLGMPLEKTLEPDSIRFFQSTFQQQDQESQAQAGAGANLSPELAARYQPGASS